MYYSVLARCTQIPRRTFRPGFPFIPPNIANSSPSCRQTIIKDGSAANLPETSAIQILTSLRVLFGALLATCVLDLGGSGGGDEFFITNLQHLRPLKDMGLKRSLLPPSASSRVRILIIVVIIIIIRISWGTATWCGRWK